MPDPNAPAWVITNQQDASDLGPDGTYVSGVKVTFRTSAGVTASVFVPHSRYTVDGVREIVGERAAVANAVAGLRA